jgi:hypothetical protein
MTTMGLAGSDSELRNAHAGKDSGKGIESEPPLVWR